MSRTVIVHPDAPTLGAAVAARLITKLIDLQSVTPVAHIVVTGGTLGIRSLAEVATSAAAGAIDWSGVHIWWGDERFLPLGDPDRNETQAREALIDVLGDALPLGNVHPMPALDPSLGMSVPADSAAAYAAELASFAGPGLLVPQFDVLMLGMGPDGHVASLFPGHEGLFATGVSVTGIHGSPKPPPDRVSLTFEAIRSAREVWVVAAGSEKAAAVAAALGGTDVSTCPAGAVSGVEATLWLVDAAAVG